MSVAIKALKDPSLELILRSVITLEQIEELIYFSNHDPEVIKDTSDFKRFADKEAFERWRAKGRALYILSNNEGRLKGIFWVGLKLIPEKEFTKLVQPQDFGITVAMRIYGDVRAKGVGQPFAEASLREYFKQRKDDMNGFWLEASGDNLAIQRIFGKLGFEVATKEDINKKILMVCSGETLRRSLELFGS